MSGALAAPLNRDTKPGSIPAGCPVGRGIPKVPPTFSLPSLGAYLLRERGQEGVEQGLVAGWHVELAVGAGGLRVGHDQELLDITLQQRRRGEQKAVGFLPPPYPYPGPVGCPRASQTRVLVLVASPVPTAAESPWMAWGHPLGWVEGVEGARRQRDPCLPAGDKMGSGGGAAPLASMPPLCPWPLTFTVGRNAGRGTRSPHRDGDTPWGQRTAPSASTDHGKWVPPPSPDPSLPVLQDNREALAQRFGEGPTSNTSSSRRRAPKIVTPSVLTRGRGPRSSGSVARR